MTIYRNFKNFYKTLNFRASDKSVIDAMMLARRIFSTTHQTIRLFWDSVPPTTERRVVQRDAASMSAGHRWSRQQLTACSFLTTGAIGWHQPHLSVRCLDSWKEKTFFLNFNKQSQSTQRIINSMKLFDLLTAAHLPINMCHCHIFNIVSTVSRKMRGYFSANQKQSS